MHSRRMHSHPMLIYVCIRRECIKKRKKKKKRKKNKKKKKKEEEMFSSFDLEMTLT
jgi:predicted RNA-binding protein YlxR (DUF448 family)